MKPVVSAFLAGACAFGSPAFAALTTTGTFTRWAGDVGDPNVWEVRVNDIVVPNNLPDAHGFAQGEIVFAAPQPSVVEFKNGQVGVPGFSTPTVMAFSGTTQATPASTSDLFKLGTIALTNGIFFFEAAADITVATVSDDPAFDGRSFSDTLKYIVTPNTGTDEQNADYAYFIGHPELGQIRVYEAASPFPNTGSIELWGRIGSLDPIEFRNPTGGVFVQSVPEPATYALFGCGLALVGAFAYRRRCPY